MVAFFDLHLHTDQGSGDSVLTPQEMVQEATRIGLHGVVLTEHEGWSDRSAFRAFAREQELVLIYSLELDTEHGHVLAFGIEEHEAGFRDLRVVRQAADRVGGYLVVSHPFRRLFDHRSYSRNLLYPNAADFPKSPEEAARHPIFSLVDDLEVLNGANSEQENRFALEVAHCLGRPGTGGGDAHSRQGIARGSTRIDGAIRSQADFLEAMRARAYAPIEELNRGRPRVFGGDAISQSAIP